MALTDGRYCDAVAIREETMDEQRELHRYDRRHDPTRVLALSDGVFAIVITLLVLEIRVPDLARGQTLREAFAEVRPSFIGFLISFVVVAIAWAGHRDLFSLIRRMDRNLVWLNILYLFPLSLLPFGAALISRYEEDRGGARHVRDRAAAHRPDPARCVAVCDEPTAPVVRANQPSIQDGGRAHRGGASGTLHARDPHLRTVLQPPAC